MTLKATTAKPKTPKQDGFTGQFLPILKEETISILHLLFLEQKKSTSQAIFEINTLLT